MNTFYVIIAICQVFSYNIFHVWSFMEKLSRKKQALLTEQKIISSTEELLKTMLFHELQIKDICKEANISVGNFYHYFSNKQSIVIKILDIRSKEYSSIISALPSDDLKQKILFVFLEFCSIVEKLGGELVLELFVYNITSQVNFLLDKDNPLYKELYLCIMALQQKNLLLVDESIESITNTLIIFFRGFLYEWCLCKGEYSLTEEIKKQLTRYLSLFML